MWHASIAYHGSRGNPTWPSPHLYQARLDKALRALRGVGDRKLGEWIDHTDKATHLRRRLSIEEAHGFVLLDVRGTPEAERLLAPVRRYLPIGYSE